MRPSHPRRSEGQKSVQDPTKYATTGVVRATEGELAALPPRLAALLRALFVPTAETMYVPTCGLNIIYLDTYLNHSPHPNLRTKDGVRFITTRRVQEVRS